MGKRKMNEILIIKCAWKTVAIHENHFSKIEIKMGNITKLKISQIIKMI